MGLVRQSPVAGPGMHHLNLTDEEAAALINLLTAIIEGDEHPLAQRMKTLRRIRSKLAEISPGPRRKEKGAPSSKPRSWLGRPRLIGMPWDRSR